MASSRVDLHGQSGGIFTLPLELLQHMLSFLPAQSLVSLGHTCRDLYQHTYQEKLWLDLLHQQTLKHDFANTTEPAASYSQLYLAHHPYWFLVRQRLWFSNKDIYRGQLMVTRYTSDGAICGYKVIAQLPLPLAESWALKPNVIIHHGKPRIGLATSEPMLEVPSTSAEKRPRSSSWSPADEIRIYPESSRAAATFLALARDLPLETANAPNVLVWPPRTIPDVPRTRSSEVGNSASGFTAKGHRPSTIDEISQTNFRIRSLHQSSGSWTRRTREDVSTWSALPRHLIEPNKRKPYQGLFAGDYATHGCEFLLILQTDAAPTRPSTPPLDFGTRNYLRDMIQRYRALEDEEDDDWSEAGRGVVPNVPDEDGTIHRGAIEAVKITGDENVPRGEHTFIADDIGPRGLIRIAHESPFRGARVVKSRGHVADTRFTGDQWLNSELFLINENTLAQYWKLFRHISYYHRVDLDALDRL